MKRKLKSLAFFKKKQEEVSLEASENEYFESISKRFAITQVVLYLCLFAFILVFFFRNINLITYQNFYHFFQDLGATASASEVFSEEAVIYPTSSEQSFTLYREGLAIAGNQSLTLFSSSGRQSFSVNLDNYRNPIAEGKGKYLLVYELGGTRYSLYNFYTKLHEGTTERPITGATVADNGMYAIISSTEQYASVVSLYNDRFDLVGRYNYVESDGYVMDADVTEDGSSIAILTSASAGDGFRTVLRIYKPGEKSAVKETLLGTSLGLDCSFSNKSALIVLCTNGIFFTTAKGEIVATQSFQKASPVASVMDERGVAVVLEGADASQKDRLLVFDPDGKLQYQASVSDRIHQISRYGNSIFLLSTGQIRRISVKGGNDTVWEGMTDGRRMLALRENEILLCSPQKAVYIPIGS